MIFKTTNHLRVNNGEYYWYSAKETQPANGSVVIVACIRYYGNGEYADSRTTVARYIDGKWVDCIDESNKNLDPLLWTFLPEAFTR